MVTHRGMPRFGTSRPISRTGALSLLISALVLGLIVGPAQAQVGCTPADPSGCPIPLGARVAGTVTAPGQVDTWRVTLPRGGRVRADVPHTAANLDLFLVDAQRNVLVTDTRDDLIDKSIE